MKRERSKRGVAACRETLSTSGAVAQLGERLLCKQDVIGSIPVSSTKSLSKGIDANLLEVESPLMAETDP